MSSSAMHVNSQINQNLHKIELANPNRTLIRKMTVGRRNTQES